MTIRFRLAYLLGAILCIGWATALRAQEQAPPAKKITKDTTFTYSVLYSFTGPPEGAYPSLGNLMQAQDGNYYGVTLGGGTSTGCGGNDGCGTVFKITPSGTLTTLYSFCAQADCSVAELPNSGLVQGSDGNFYGTTQYGGANMSECGGDGCGTVFKITPSGALTTLYSFCSQTDCADGENPAFGALVQGSDGNLYGTTLSGGANRNECGDEGCGTVFKITLSGTLTTLYSFCGMTNCSDGANPGNGGLVQGSDGNFYGTTGYGGANVSDCDDQGCGTVFKITSSGNLTTLYSFCSKTNCADGTVPLASLVQGDNGNFYGITFEGGNTNECNDAGCGTIFEITPTGSLTTLHSFCNQTGCGYDAVLGLFLGSDGNFYGTTAYGGANAASCPEDRCGTVFQITSAGVFTTLYNFCSEPGCGDGFVGINGSVIQGSNGGFYGTTEGGGADSLGTIYQLSATPALSAPVQLSLSASSISLDNSVTLTWQVLNAFSLTMQQCYAFVQNSATGAGTWTGLQSGTLTSGIYSGSASITPTATGTYTYALTCGGIESGFATLTVTPAATPDITFSSVTHNMGSVLIGNSTTYGVQLTNHTPNKFPFALTLSTTASPNPFSYQTNCGTSVPADAKCEIVFTYAPKSGNSGTQTAAWFLAPNGFTFGPSNGGTLTGTVATAANLTVTTGGHNWGDQTVGTTSPVYGVVLTNSTPDNINMTYALGNTTDFSLVTNCPGLLGAGVSCNLNFTFTPKSAGFLSTTEALAATDAKTSDPVTIYIKGSSTPVTGISLKGTGD